MSAKGSIDGVVADFKGDIIQVNDLQWVPTSKWWSIDELGSQQME
jgi:hypothetical protein